MVTTNTEYKGGTYTITITSTALNPEDVKSFALANPGKPNRYTTTTVKLTGAVNPK